LGFLSGGTYSSKSPGSREARKEPVGDGRISGGDAFHEPRRHSMSAIRGIIRKGQVIMTEPADLPDETEVEIVPVGLGGSADDEGMLSPDEIARTLAAMDAIEPFEMTDEERAAIEADR